MNFRVQEGCRDCFTTCLYNAMQHVDVSVIPALAQRFDVFRNGKRHVVSTAGTA